MVKFKVWESLDLGLDGGQDVMQGATQGCSVVRWRGMDARYGVAHILMKPTLRPGCSCMLPSSMLWLARSVGVQA